jgi:hypothetical protein
MPWRNAIEHIGPRAMAGYLFGNTTISHFFSLGNARMGGQLPDFFKFSNGHLFFGDGLRTGFFLSKNFGRDARPGANSTQSPDVRS